MISFSKIPGFHGNQISVVSNHSFKVVFSFTVGVLSPHMKDPLTTHHSRKGQFLMFPKMLPSPNDHWTTPILYGLGNPRRQHVPPERKMEYTPLQECTIHLLRRICRNRMCHHIGRRKFRNCLRPLPASGAYHSHKNRKKVTTIIPSPDSEW
jgi:hypothetical protein